MLETEDTLLVPEPIADGLIIRLAGEIDLRRAPELRARLLDVQRSHPPRLIIDFSAVDLIDSSVVAVLIESLQTSRRGAGIMILCGMRPRVRGVFEITRLHASPFTVVETTDDAIALANRRKFGRYRPGSVRCDRGKILDVSAAGLRLESRRKLRGIVTLKLYDETDHLDLRAEVSWTKRLGFRRHEVGLHFADVRTEQAKKLARLVEAARDYSARRRPAA